MKINKRWLKKQNACEEGIIEFNEQKERDSIKILELLIKKKKYDWANWLIVRLMKYKQYVSYAVFAAEQVLPIFEKEYPNDDRPRIAIEAAKKCIKRNNQKNRDAARAAGDAAWVAGNAAWAAGNAAWAAGYAAETAAKAAGDAAEAAGDAAEAAGYAAAWVTGYAAEAAWGEMQIKILNYGIKLLKK